MDKYLVLTFKNARLFRTQDFSFDMYGSQKSADAKMFEEPITVHQISNMIHVLFGERPVPSKREVLFKKNDYLFEKANQSYLKIDSYKNYNEKHDRYDLSKEFMQTKKAVYNSHRSVGLVYWKRVSRYLGPEFYCYFLNELKNNFNITPADMTFEKVKAFLNERKDDERVLKIYEMLSSNRKSALFNYIFKNQNQINETAGVRLTVINGVAKCTKLSGEILVPVNDSDLELLQKSKGCATLLDGGLVFIKRIQSAHTLNVSKFQKVNQISLNKISYEN